MKKRFISLALSVLLVFTLMSGTVGAASYSDVNGSDWFYEAVNYCTEKGLMNGVGNDRFAPQDTMTRAQFVTILGRMDGVNQSDYTGNGGFTDVVTGSWYAPYVVWAKQFGVTSGVTSTTFAPDDNVTREQVATFVARYLNLKCTQLQKDAKPAPAFPDSGSISAWAKDAVEAMRLAGLLRGSDQGLVQPGKNMTRAEGATFLMRLDQAIQKAGSAHDWDDGVVTKQFTCTEDGEITYTCKNNSEHVRTEVVPAHHVFGESVVVKEPTCEVSGLEEGVCTVCGEKRTNEIPALGHKLKLVKGTEPTCENPGVKDVWRCTVCDKTFLDEDGTIVADDSNTVIPALGHEWKEVYESKSFPLYKMEQHEFCDICHRDLTEIDYTEAYGHLAAHDSEDPNYMKTHMEYVATENGSLETKQLVGYKCERCGDTKDAEATEHVHDYQPIMFTVELPAFKFVKLHRCSACGMDCTNMTEEEWQEHFDSHMLKTDGEFAIRYDSAESVQDGTRKFNVQIGWKCADNDSEVYFTMFAPQYDFSKSIDKTAVLDGNICNADGCNAIYSCGGYVKGFVVFEDLGTFVTSDEARGAHTEHHLFAHEASGYRSFSNMEAVISYTHHRDFVSFVQL